MKIFIRFSFILCCLFFLSFNSIAQSPGNDSAVSTVAEKFFKQGVENLTAHANDLTYSLGDFSQAIFLMPEEGKYYFWRAKTLIKQNGADYALRDLARARSYGYSETEIAALEKSAYDVLGGKPADLNAFLQSRESQMVKFAYSKIPAMMEQPPFCYTVADCLKRGEAVLQVADRDERMQSIYLANEALRLSPENADALLLRARAYAITGVGPYPERYEGVNICEMAVRDARQAVVKNPDLVSSDSADNLWILIEENNAIRRAPYFYCAEYAKANPARREIDAKRTERVAEVKREWEKEKERIEQENAVSNSSGDSGNELQDEYDELISDLKAANQQYDDAIKKLQRAYEADARNGTTANTFYKGTRARAQRQLDYVHNRIKEFLRQYGKRLPANIREELQDWDDRVPTTVPI